ncbi:LicD family protein [Vibrio splendidus]|uniref:LicD family protein n=1 Tax=Vibrio splendidus TaxID=29497 RepID=UPI0012FFE1EB|nr:LicD family protein [Vibrio splendidus]
MKIKNVKGVEYYSRNGLELHQEEMLKLLKLFSEVCKKNNISYWLDGGSLLGMQRHGGFIPWDDDIDICVPYNDYVRLKKIFNEYTKTDASIGLYYDSHGIESWCDYLCTFDCVYESKSGFIKPVKIDILPVKNIEKNMIEVDETLVDLCASVVKGKGFSEIEHNCSSLNDALKIKQRILLQYRNYMKNHSDFGVHSGYIVKAHGQFSPIKKIGYEFVYPLNKAVFCGVEVYIPCDILAYLEQSYGSNYMSLPAIDKRKPTAIDTYYIDGNDSVYRDKIEIGVNLDNVEFYYSKKKTGSLRKFFSLVKVQGLLKSCSLIFNYFK